VRSSDLPASAAWRHQDARQGFEVVHIRQQRSGCRLQGYTAAVEDGGAWVVGYDIDVAESWLVRTAQVWADSTGGLQRVRLDTDGAGNWQVNDTPAPHLDGCLDVDLESSACTNTLPVHRLQLGTGGVAEPPAAYVRAPDLAVERLEQTYARVNDDRTRHRYDYTAPRFDFACRLVYDEAGLVIEYPGIACRAH